MTLLKTYISHPASSKIIWPDPFQRTAGANRTATSLCTAVAGATEDGGDGRDLGKNKNFGFLGSHWNIMETYGNISIGTYG